MMQERRKHSRKLVNSRVMIYHPEVSAFESITKDISNAGIRISIKESYTDKIQPNDKIKVVFLNSGDVALIFNMTIVRVSKDEVAMEILNCEKNGNIFPVSDLRDVLNQLYC